MKQSINYSVLRTAALSLAALTLASCTAAERPADGPTPAPKAAQFTVSVSAPTRSAATRAILENTPADNRVDDIAVLLFDSNDEFAGCVRGTELSTPVPVSGGGWRLTFRAAIPDGTYTALFLANAAWLPTFAVYDVAPGGSVPYYTIDEVEATLRHEIPAGADTRYNSNADADPADADYQPFVMSSARTAVTVAGNGATVTAPDPIPLYRDVAKINLTVAPGVPFKITQIILINQNRETFAVPSTALTAMWSDPDPALTEADRIRRPLFADGVTRSGANAPVETDVASPRRAVYQGADITGNGTVCVDEIFTCERPALVGPDGSKKPLCLLVQADVTAGGESDEGRWYKLELTAKEDPDSDERPKHVNILRNYAYTVTITGVGNLGHGSESEAYLRVAEGLAIDITAVSEEGMNEFVFNGEYQLAVDNSKITLAGEAGASAPMRVYTDYWGGWQVRSNTGEDWLSFAPAGTSAANALNVPTPVTVTASKPNFGPLPRTATVTLAAGTLRKDVTVTQNVTAAPPPEVESIPVTIIHYIQSLENPGDYEEALTWVIDDRYKAGEVAVAWNHQYWFDFRGYYYAEPEELIVTADGDNTIRIYYTFVSRR